jgi:hypothetical protein
MTSMRRLNRRLLRWRRYAARTYWSPRMTQPRWMLPRSAVACSPGHTRAWDALQREIERRCWAETPEVWLGGPAGEGALIGDVLGGCDVCGMPDPYRGQGDGIGSCDCPRCDCGAARSSSFCACDPACSDCLSKTCEGDCDEVAYADEDSDPWPPGVVTEYAFAERGLL